jgi:plasmid maintenance system antidote protein VapI
MTCRNLKKEVKQNAHLTCHAHLEYGYTLKEIADLIGVHYIKVSKIVRKKKN